MQVGVVVNYGANFREVVDEIVQLESGGLSSASIPEVYGFDAVSQLGFIAARTSKLQITSGILPLYSRTPALLAMTAAGLDMVSAGRFTLGLGASGPQVIEGFHGVPYDAPLARTREVIDICRSVWKREKLEHHGTYFDIPLPHDKGLGLGKPLHLSAKPVRASIPILLAALGPKNVALAAEIAEIWEPTLFLPEKADSVWGEALAEGEARRSSDLPPLRVHTNAMLAIGDDTAQALAAAKGMLALYIGGMGAPQMNFYHRLACRYGYADEADRIQQLYLSGRKDEATSAVPDELARDLNLIGPKTWVTSRLEAFAQAGVSTIQVTPLAQTPEQRISDVTELCGLASDLEQITD